MPATPDKCRLVQGLAASALLLLPWPAAAQNAEAEPAPPAEAEEAPAMPEVEVRFDHYVFIPQTPNVVRDFDDPFYTGDPTIIPFSNWLFYGPDGDWQPWRKREITYRHMQGGQHGSARPSKLFVRWTSPSATPIYTTEYILSDNTFHSGTARNSQNEGADVFHQLTIDVPDPALMPETLGISMRFTTSEYELIERFGFDAEFPVGNDHFTVKYFGPLRQETLNDWMANGSLPQEEHADLYTLEAKFSEQYPRDRWLYRLEISPSDEVLGFPRNVISRGDGSRLYGANLEAFEYASITRQAVHTAELAELDLQAASGLTAEENGQQRVEVTFSSRFGEPTTIHLQPQAAGAQSLLDLDQLRLTAYPDEDLDWTEMAMLLEEEEVDLMLGLNREAPCLLMVASPAYQLDPLYWDRKPQSCIDEIAQGHPGYTILIPMDRPNIPYLTTTSDGSMVLFRVIEVAPDDGETPGQATLEVRRLVGP